MISKSIVVLLILCVAVLLLSSYKGTTTAYMATENLMEHIASVVKRDSVQVRLNNFSPKSAKLKEMMDELAKKADYNLIIKKWNQFNSENQWKKRGITILPMKYDLGYPGYHYAVISIYQNDGHVVISHGGIEMGQGINTQAVQTCAKELGVPLHYINVHRTMVLTSPNNVASGGSVSSECVVLAVTKCCKILNERLAPVRATMFNPTWPDLIAEAARRFVNLNAVDRFDLRTDNKPYQTTGVSVCEVELDCLTGEHQVLRLDVLEEAGLNVNPYIDIGQVEGALVMALGLCTCEEIMYNTDTGKMITDRSWEYKVPQVKDIPIDMRVHLKESPNREGPTRAKAISEPPSLLAYSVIVGLRRAIESFRRDLGYREDFFRLECPATRERLFLTCDPDHRQFLLRK